MEKINERIARLILDAEPYQHVEIFDSLTIRDLAVVQWNLAFRFKWMAEEMQQQAVSNWDIALVAFFTMLPMLLLYHFICAPDTGRRRGRGKECSDDDSSGY